MTEPPVKSTTASSTMTIKTKQGHMVIVEHVADVSKGDKSKTEQKADDESRGMQVVQAKVYRNLEPSDTVNVDWESWRMKVNPHTRRPMKRINWWLNLKTRLTNLPRHTNSNKSTMRCFITRS